MGIKEGTVDGRVP